MSRRFLVQRSQCRKRHVTFDSSNIIMFTKYRNIIAHETDSWYSEIMKKTVLITGASRGIGAAAARRFAEEGFDLILICREKMDLLKELAAEMKERHGISVKCFSGDTGDEAFVRKTVEEAGTIDVLINNAGISKTGLLTDMSLAEWEEILNANLTSVFLFCKYTVPEMVRRKSGRIINISSVWGSVGASCEAAYSASKGGVEALTKALAKELAPSGIMVNAVAPGCIDTDMNAHLSEDDRRSLSEEIPMGRFGRPEEAAELIFGVATAPEYLTGQVITLSGGWMN